MLENRPFIFDRLLLTDYETVAIFIRRRRELHTDHKFLEYSEVIQLAGHAAYDPSWPANKQTCRLEKPGSSFQSCVQSKRLILAKKCRGEIRDFSCVLNGNRLSG